jgi:uncharacterized membrane protein YccC
MPSGQAAQPGAWMTFWRGVAKFQTSKINYPIALRNTIGVAIPLLIGAATGHLGAGLIASTGALQVAFRDSDAPYRERANFMLAASVIAGFAVMLGSMGANSSIGSVVLAAVWAFSSGMLVALGQPAGELGLLSLVLVLIYGAVPMEPSRAAGAGLAAFAGGVLQTMLAVANWFIDPRAPVRRAIGDLYLAISAQVVVARQASEAPPATQESIQAQQAMQALSGDSSPECDRLRFALIQAERLRLSLLALARVRVRLERDLEPPPGESETLDRFIAEVSRITGAIGGALKSGAEPGSISADAERAGAIAESLRGIDAGPEAAAMVKDARVQMDAIAGQLRSAIDVLRKERPPRAESAPATRQKRWMVLRDRVLTLHANLSLDSGAFRHAVRLAVSIAIGDGVARAAGVTRPYWLPMTIAIVLRPDFATTFSRGVLRLIGTFAGILLATGLVLVMPDTIWVHIAIVAGLIFVVRSVGAANYGVFATAITAVVVFLVWLNGVAPGPAMAARALNTAAGGGIALVAYWLWPTWERHQVSDAMARMLDALCAYFAAVRENYTAGSAGSAEKLERARVAGRLARSNWEASAARAVGEPGVTAESIQLLNAILASSHRFVQALMALEAAFATAERMRPREALHKFADDVCVTLSALSSALGGVPVDAGKLPDLREDHHELIHSGESGGLYGLVNVETDRITNALNTLGGEVLEWVELQARR